jgi:hypothetical protein
MSPCKIRCRTRVPSEAVRSFAAVLAPKAKSPRRARRMPLVERLMGGVDLLIDFATLGEYGLEPLPAEGSLCEASGHMPGWEAPLALGTRRGSCGLGDRVLQRT